MPNPAKVGDGHGGSEDYATIPLWIAAEFATDYGVQLEAQCLGNTGSNYTVSSSNINGAIAYTDGVTYDGTNQSSLAKVTRTVLNGGLSFRDICFNSNNSFASPVSLAAGWDGETMLRVYIEHGNSPSGVDCIPTTGSTPNSTITQAVVNATGCVNGFDLGFAFGITLENITVFGAASGDGVEGSGSGQSIIDSFSFNNSANDYAGGSLSKTTCASEDLTGTLTGFTSSELVNFGVGDYRTKSTSTLAAAGTNTAFIGAFLEVSAGISVTETLKNINYNSLDPVITLTGSLSITESLVNTNYTTLNPVITLTGVISITEQLKNTNYTSLDPIIDLTGLVDITESLVNTNYIALNPTITLTAGVIAITESTVNTQYSAINPSILLTPEPLGIVSTVCFDGVLVNIEHNGTQNEVSFNGQSINIEFNGNFNEIEFNGTIQTSCNPGSIKTNC